MEGNNVPARLDVEFLFLDRDTCFRCSGTEQSLKKALQLLQPILDVLGVELRLHEIKVDSPEKAVELEFVSSPTIRVNGRDLQPDLEESQCESCGDLCGETVNCRVWTFQGHRYTTPPVGLLVDGILGCLYRPHSGDTGPGKQNAPGFQLPPNLVRFFEAQKDSAAGPCAPEPCCPGNASDCSC